MILRRLIAALIGAGAAFALVGASAGHAEAQVGIESARPTVRIAVAARALARGATIGADDIVYKDSVTHAAGDSSRVSAGWVTRRAISAGEVLREPAVEPPNVVFANQPVDVEWRDGNVSLSLRGIATRSAGVGDRIAVRGDAGRRYEGTVVAPGRVRID